MVALRQPRDSGPEGLPCVYRHFDADGRLLYVGFSQNLFARMEDHRATSPWFQKVMRVRIDHYHSPEEAAKAERRAIFLERPLYNGWGGDHELAEIRAQQIEKLAPGSIGQQALTDSLTGNT